MCSHPIQMRYIVYTLHRGVIDYNFLIKKVSVFLSLKTVFISANITDHDEIPH